MTFLRSVEIEHWIEMVQNQIKSKQKSLSTFSLYRIYFSKDYNTATKGVRNHTFQNLPIISFILISFSNISFEVYSLTSHYINLTL